MVQPSYEHSTDMGICVSCDNDNIELDDFTISVPWNNPVPLPTPDANYANSILDTIGINQ